MRYTWDERKNRRNIERRKIAFEDAVRIFEGRTVETEDDRFDYGEVRVKAIGLMAGIVVVVVIYTDRGTDERRIISARKADSREAAEYYEEIHRGH
jgi:uncharacterized DUF497 family protein